MIKEHRKFKFIVRFQREQQVIIVFADQFVPRICKSICEIKKKLILLYNRKTLYV